VDEKSAANSFLCAGIREGRKTYAFCFWENMPTVGDYMNPRLVYLREGDRPEVALRPMLDFGIHAVPILDDDHRPVGMVTLGDLIDRDGDLPKREPMTIREDASVDEAARLMTSDDIHHLVVVDEHGHAIGNLSTLDVVRGLIAATPRHPEAIAQFEQPAIAEPAARSPR